MTLKLENNALLCKNTSDSGCEKNETESVDESMQKFL